MLTEIVYGEFIGKLGVNQALSVRLGAPHRGLATISSTFRVNGFRPEKCHTVLKAGSLLLDCLKIAGQLRGLGFQLFIEAEATGTFPGVPSKKSK
jgi:hypothetical protein